MPLIAEEEIDFDAMSNEELAEFLAKLREESNKRRPRQEVKSAAGKKERKIREYIKIDV